MKPMSESSKAPVSSPGAPERGLLVPVAVGLLLVLTPGEAAGYIDPISGSIILQVLGAALLGAALSVKRVWAGISGVCTRVWDRISRPWRE